MYIVLFLADLFFPLIFGILHQITSDYFLYIYICMETLHNGLYL